MIYENIRNGILLVICENLPGEFGLVLPRRPCFRQHCKDSHDLHLRLRLHRCSHWNWTNFPMKFDFPPDTQKTSRQNSSLLQKIRRSHRSSGESAEFQPLLRPSECEVRWGCANLRATWFEWFSLKNDASIYSEIFGFIMWWGPTSPKWTYETRRVTWEDV